MAKTLYQLLGVASNASPDAIKGAYVKQAAMLRTTGAQSHAAFLKQAYEVLADPATRQRYDRQQYLVDDSVRADDPSAGMWYLSWRAAIVAAGVIALAAYAAWTYHQRERVRLRIEHERLETQRLEQERKLAEQREREPVTRKFAQDRDNAAATRAANQRARTEAHRESLETARGMHRDSLELQHSMHRDRIELQREREAAYRQDLERRREDAERLRIEREQARRLEIERQYARELERSSPRRF